ncbi:sensor histidine kinase [Paenibacillus puerhi]|uniref:sensor histidine kinase n=1 Tax=Paenibacillus puerhi TaxID=2692622 RepID=UPI001F3AEB74|nr:HAMP domain-containing sensor histidine kinase [Paenibacillus puerhi]
MSGRISDRWRRVFPAGSLRLQLLARSLLILAALLALIGALQYVLMSDAIYRNKAESMRSQLQTLPPDVWLDRSGAVEEERSAGNAAKPSAASGANSARGPGSSAQAPGSDGQASGSNGQAPGADIRPPANELRPSAGASFRGRPTFFLPEGVLSYIDAVGHVTDLPGWDEEQAKVVPHLTREAYMQMLNEDRRDWSYQVMKAADGTEQLVVIARSDLRNRKALLQLSVNTKPLQEVLLRQLLIFLTVSCVALVAGLLTFLPVLRRTLVPLSNAVDTVQQIDAGNLAIRMPEQQGQIEIDRLASSFNSMLERLQSSFETEREAREQMRRFVADASHELRTPLTSIHGFLEVLLRGAADQPDKLYNALNSMHSESKRINKLVSDLLLLAKLDRAPLIQLEDGALSDVIREMEPQLRLLAGSRALRLETATGGRCRFEPDKIKQVILNLFHNAVQHTDAQSGVITISLHDGPDHVHLSVRDNGPGMEPDRLPHIFERFYRVDSSRTRMNGGAGLGLSISQTIIEAHGGRIEVESEVGRGSCFRISLPR